VALAGQAQTGYTFYSLAGPPALPLFDRAFTSNGEFGGVATDGAGNVYVVFGPSISKINAQGIMIPVTGFGPAAVAPGEQIWALLASTESYSLAGDSQGDLFIATGNAIYRVDPGGLMEYYASVPAEGIACDGNGNLYALLNGSQVVRVASNGATFAVAGTGVAGFSGDGGPATSAQIQAVFMAVDTPGNIFLGDLQSNRIRKVDLNGTITTVAQLASLNSMAAFNGAVYYSQYSSPYGGNPNQVMRVGPSGAVETVAGVPYSSIYQGDGGPATMASLTDVNSLALDAAGNLYIADFSRLRKVDTAGIIHTVSGCLCGGDGGPAPWAQTGAPAGMAQDSAGNVYFSDQGSHMVRRIAPDGTIAAVAGIGESGFSGDGGPATAARLAWPAGLAFDSAGNLYIADEQNNRIRQVTPGGVIQTVAGNGIAQFAGDGGPATAASLGLPDGVAVDASGNLYIADTASHRIRKVAAGGTIQTIAGSDQYGSSGDGGPAALAQLINPRSLAFDQAGNLLLTDSPAHVVRRITPAGIIQRVAGTGQDGTSGNGGSAVAALLDLPWGITVDASGNVLIGDGYAVRSVDPSGTIQNVSSYFDGVARGLVVDSGGDIWVAGNTVGALSRGGPPFPLGPLITNQAISNTAAAGLPLYPIYQSAAIAPGEFVTIPGVRLGPGSAVTANPVATNLDGVRVLFDGILAPILSVSASQINAIAPYEISGKSSVGIVVEVNGVSSNTSTVAVLPAVPQFYMHSFGTLIAATALNQDGTENGPLNPAPVGSVITLFAAGAGNMIPPPGDGAIVSSQQLPVPALPVSVTLAGRPLQVLYAGGAPGIVSGALQVNVVVPSDIVPLPAPYYPPVELYVGNSKSLAAYVWLKP